MLPSETGAPAGLWIRAAACGLEPVCIVLSLRVKMITGGRYEVDVG